jgi:peptide/nickel transport system substrate-binding protein
MTAVIGEDRKNWQDHVGYFLPGTAMASDAGMDALKDPPDRAAATRLLKESGYGGEKLVLLIPADFPTIKAQGEVIADALKQIGMALDVQEMDWGTVITRVNNQGPPDKGGWHMTTTFTAGSGLLNPVNNNFLRGTGPKALFGWPKSEKLESLRDAWFQAPDRAAQQRICAQIQQTAFEEVPYIPTGLYRSRTAHRADIIDLPKGLPLFYGVRRA